MKKIYFLLALFLHITMQSQSFIGFTIGDKIINENIYIENDSLQTKVSVFDDGYCYRIETKFLETDREDVDYVKQFVNTDKVWDDYLKESTGMYDSEFNRDKPYNGGSFIATVTEGNVKYLIFYDDRKYDDSLPGLVLIEKTPNIGDLPGIEKKVRNKPTNSMTFKSYEDCVNSPVYKEKKAAWEALNRIPVEKIELPYKFNFGMTPLQISNHFKTILDKNSVLKISPMSSNKQEIQLGLSYNIYSVKTNGANSFSVEVKFFNGKAVDYNYHHDYDLDQKLREKIKALKEKYVTVGSTFGNNIYDVKSMERIQELKEKNRNRGNLGSKM